MKSFVYLLIAILIVYTSSFTAVAAPIEDVNTFSCGDITEIPQIECEALVALYNSTNGSGWMNNTNWLVTNTPSDWYGVWVTSGHVIQLHLTNNQLSGSIPAELGNIASLTQLYLSENQLNSSIPPQLGNLSNLYVLSLENNQLNGSIPVDLGNLTNLGHLWLSNNQLSSSIPAELGNLINLRTLYLNNNQLDGDVPGSFINLTRLYCPGCAPIHADGLDLDYNHLIVPPGYPDPGNPLHMFLYQKDPDWHLHQTAEFIDCTSVSEIPQTECEALVSLYSNTNGDGWTNHSNWLYTDTPSDWFGVTVSQTHVTGLDLSNNQLLGSLPPELGDLPNLTVLSLWHNQISGSLPPELGNLSNLTKMDLISNHLSGDIPPELGMLSNMLWLWLNDNQLSGSIPSELGSLSSLQFLDLSGNQLEGNIPAQLGDLTTLQVLRLNHNNLDGNVPNTLINLTNLFDPGQAWDGGDGLDLDYNLLTVPPGYPDPLNPLQVFLHQKDLDWQFYQGFNQVIGAGGGELTSLDGKTDFLIPEGALITDTTFTFIPLPSPTHNSTILAFAHNSFELTAKDAGGNPVTTFNLPITATLTYMDSDIIAPEDTLGLYYWDTAASAWTDAVTSCMGGEYTRDPVGNMFALPLCHLTEFGIFGVPLRTFLPVIIR